MTKSYLPAGTVLLALLDVASKPREEVRLTLQHTVAVLRHARPHAILVEPGQGS